MSAVRRAGQDLVGEAGTYEELEDLLEVIVLLCSQVGDGCGRLSRHKEGPPGSVLSSLRFIA